MIFLAWAIAGLGIGAVLFGWFWDRPGFRGRAARRCKKCWYDLGDSGELPITCPECGRESKSERSMTRVRRHKKVVAVGVILILAAPTALLIHGYRQGRLLVHVPSWVLIELLPFSPQGNKPTAAFNANYPRNELAYRLGGFHGRAISHEQIVDMLNRAGEGNVFVTPGSKRWERTTGQWFNGQAFHFRVKGSGWPYDDTGWQYPDGTPADEALIGAIDRLMRVLPEWDPHTRSVWPEGEVVTIWSLFGNPRWPMKGELMESASIVISGHQPEPEHVEVKGFLDSFQLKARGHAGDTIRCEMELRYHRVSGDRYGNPLPEPERKQQVVLEWTIAEDISDVIELVDSEQIREAMIVEIVPLLSDSIDDFDYQNATWLKPAFVGVGFGIEIQVYDGDEFLAQVEHRWMNEDGAQYSQVRTSMMGTTMEQYNAYPLRASEAIKKGTLRVKIIGDPALALEMYGAKRAWNGQIDILYTDAVKLAESSTTTTIEDIQEDEEKAP
jgi:hypothetical protein